MREVRPVLPLALWTVAAVVATFLVARYYIFFASILGRTLGDIFSILGVLIVSGLIYALLVSGLVWALPRFGGRSQASTVLMSVLVSMLGFAVTVTAFQAAAFSLRGTVEHDTFVLWAAVIFFMLYALLFAMASAVGYGLARWKGAEAAKASVTSVVALAAFMILTMPFVEFANSCLVGTAFVLPATC